MQHPLRWTVLCLPLLLAFGRNAAPARQDPRASGPAARPTARPEDVVSPDALLAAVYDVISGPAGEARDWDRFRSLFTADARLAAVASAAGREAAPLRVFTPEEYVRQSGPLLEANGFFERELRRHSERFGHVLHAFSTYAGRRTADGEDVLRGVNSFQLVHDGERWYVHSILWEAEHAGLELPERYRPAR